MAQIWLTYEEIGTLLDLPAEAARDRSIEARWSRRRCSDGLTRVKMPGGSAHAYMIRYAAAYLAGTLDEVDGVPQRNEAAFDAVAGSATPQDIANPVHLMHRQVASLGDEIIRKRVPRERDWPEPAGAHFGAAEPKWANAVRRVFG